MKTKTTSDVTYIVALGAAVLVLLVLALVLVNRESSALVAEDARSSILAEQSLSAAAAVRNGTNQALLLVSVAAADVDRAIDEVREADTQLRARFGALLEQTTGPEKAELAAVRDEFGSVTASFMEAASAGDVSDAGDLATAQGESYSRLVATVAGLRDERVAGVLIAAEGVGRVADAVRLLMVVVVPVGAILVYRRGSRRREEQARLAQELERQREITRSKDDFIADLSHELRTPLTGIYGFALALEEADSELGHDGAELLGLIITEADELSRMADDLVAAGRLDAGQITFTD